MISQNRGGGRVIGPVTGSKDRKPLIGDMLGGEVGTWRQGVKCGTAFSGKRKR